MATALSRSMTHLKSSSRSRSSTCDARDRSPLNPITTRSDMAFSSRQTCSFLITPQDVAGSIVEFHHVILCSPQELLRRVLRYGNRLGALRIRVELREDGRFPAEMLFQCPYAIRIAGMVGQDLRHLAEVGLVEVLEEPHQAPRVIAAPRAHVGSRHVGCRFGLSRVTKRVELADQLDRKDVRDRGAEQHRG